MDIEEDQGVIIHPPAPSTTRRLMVLLSAFILLGIGSLGTLGATLALIAAESDPLSPPSAPPGAHHLHRHLLRLHRRRRHRTRRLPCRRRHSLRRQYRRIHRSHHQCHHPHRRHLHRYQSLRSSTSASAQANQVPTCVPPECLLLSSTRCTNHRHRGYHAVQKIGATLQGTIGLPALSYGRCGQGYGAMIYQDL